MDISSNTLKMAFFIFCLLFSFMSFSQNENIVSKKMIRYTVKSEFKPELDKILNKLKPVDQKLMFIVNTSIKNDAFRISLTTTYDVGMEDDWIGFCEYRGKLFLLELITSETFFTKVVKDLVQVNVRKIERENEIVQPHLDNLPYWFLEYHNGNFTTKFSSY
jgi:hypothetical protein